MLVDTRIACYGVIIDRDERMLLAHWNEHGRSGWTLPGGGLEPGEDPADGARREILEETGYTAELDGVLGIDSFVIPAEERSHPTTRPLHAIRIVYRAHVTGGELTNEIGGSTDEAAWFPLDAVTTLDRVHLVDVALRYLAV